MTGTATINAIPPYRPRGLRGPELLRVGRDVVLVAVRGGIGQLEPTRHGLRPQRRTRSLPAGGWQPDRGGARIPPVLDALLREPVLEAAVAVGDGQVLRVRHRHESLANIINGYVK